MTTKRHKENLINNKSDSKRYYFLSDAYQFLLIKYLNTSTILTRLLSIFIGFNTYLMKRTLKKEKIELVICCTSDFLNPISLYKAAKSLNITYILYVFDEYIYQWVQPYRDYAKLLESEYLAYSDFFIFTNEYAAASYMARINNLNYQIVRNLLPHDYTFPNRINNIPIQNKILFAGSVYHINREVILNLAIAIEDFNIDLQLDIFSSNTNDWNTENLNGFTRTKLRDPLDYDKMLAVYNKYDLLLLPFTDSKEYKEIVMSSAPGKFAEYLATGKIIIAFAPEDSYIGWYLNHFECGIVLDQGNISNSLILLVDIIKNQETISKIKTNAIKRAKLDFEYEVNFKNFIKMLK
jgi:glycosyltransferase involved in cell wall biosynthesis